MDILAQSRAIFDKVQAIRHLLHQNAELSFCEKATSDIIAGVLDNEGISYKRVANTGLLAQIDSLSGGSDDVVVLRADIDALPICEKNNLPYISKNEGVMHACGHDIHAASLLGALMILNSNRDLFKGTVLALFQPGEELWPGGASIVLKEGHFDIFNSCIFVGQHVAPEIETGHYGVCNGLYMASTDEVRIEVKGKGGHGALPYMMADSVLTAATLITSLQQIVSRNAVSTVPTVLSIGKVIANGATNVIPDSVFLEGTLRTFDETWRAKAKVRINEIADGVCSAYGCKAVVDIKDGFPSVINDNAIAAKAKQALSELVGKENVIDLEMRMTGEDFGFYSRRFPSVFFRLGVKQPSYLETGSLHNSNFNPNEEALIYGISSMVSICLKVRG